NGKQDKYALGTRIGTTFAAPAKQPVVQIWPTSRGMYEVTGSINGYPVKFLVDTGATLIAMNAPQARRLGIDYRVVGEPGLSSTASGIAKTYAVKLDRVRVGDIQLKDVDAAVIDGNFPTEVLLGNSFLNRLDMKREGKALLLRKKF
ncbi:MAG: TIGR02281 family clan AA aspartic protease, partial [Gammaproteobacteria bacterium]